MIDCCASVIPTAGETAAKTLLTRRRRFAGKAPASGSLLQSFCGGCPPAARRCWRGCEDASDTPSSFCWKSSSERQPPSIFLRWLSASRAQMLARLRSSALSSGLLVCLEEHGGAPPPTCILVHPNSRTIRKSDFAQYRELNSLIRSDSTCREDSQALSRSSRL